MSIDEKVSDLFVGRSPNGDVVIVRGNVKLALPLKEAAFVADTIGSFRRRRNGAGASDEPEAVES